MFSAQEVGGKVTLKHIYEIAKIKKADPAFEFVEMKEICRLIIGTSHSCGIEVVQSLEPNDYQEFLDERRRIVAEQEAELLEAKAAKLLRIV